MKRIALLIALIAIVGATTSLSAKEKTIQLQLEAFTEIDMSVVMNLKVKHGSDFFIKASGSDELIDELKIYVSGQRLIIKGRNRRNLSNMTIDAEITLPIALGKIEISGIGEVDIRSQIDPDKFVALISGVGKLKMEDVKTTHFESVLGGLGVIEVSGNAKSAVIRNSGMGAVNCKKLLAERVECSNSGMGSVEVYASESINASNSGMGSVRYFGNPKDINKKNSGMGSVKQGD